jgi:hypothetical protein
MPAIKGAFQALIVVGGAHGREQKGAFLGAFLVPEQQILNSDIRIRRSGTNNSPNW